MTGPFRIKIEGYCATPIQKWRDNATANADYPRIEKKEAHLRSLAVVGGGPSLAESIDELRSWDGDIWAINDAATYLTERGIRCTLFTVDADTLTGDAENAILATVCNSDLFRRYAGRVRCFDCIETHTTGLAGGSTSATRAPAAAFFMGYTSVSFFGCEGSFTDRNHAYDAEENPSQLIISAGGNCYRTSLPFLLQSQELAQLMVFDGVFSNRSGGLLKAIIDHPDTWEVVAVSAALKANLERNGPTGMFDEPYQPATSVARAA